MSVAGGALHFVYLHWKNTGSLTLVRRAHNQLQPLSPSPLKTRLTGQTSDQAKILKASSAVGSSIGKAISKGGVKEEEGASFSVPPSFRPRRRTLCAMESSVSPNFAAMMFELSPPLAVPSTPSPPRDPRSLFLKLLEFFPSHQRWLDAHLPEERYQFASVMHFLLEHVYQNVFRRDLNSLVRVIRDRVLLLKPSNR